MFDVVPGDPVASAYIVRVLMFEVVFVSFLSLWAGPRIAARRVRAEAGVVFRESVEPHIGALLQRERAVILADVAAQIDSVGQRFEDLRTDARAEVERREAEARAQLEAQQAEAMKAVEARAAQLEAEANDRVKAEAERIIAEARSEAGRYLGGRSAEARAVQRVTEAAAEAQIAAWAASVLGEGMATRALLWVQRTVPNAWKAAVQDPERAAAILGPVLGLAQQGQAANMQRAARGSSPDVGASW